MANWIKFSDRMPTEDDLDIHGGLFLCDPSGKGEYMKFGPFSHAFRAIYERYEGYYWLENNAPPVPKPRTLEDVVKEYLYNAGNTIQRLVLQDEMQDILEKKLDNQDS